MKPPVSERLQHCANHFRQNIRVRNYWTPWIECGRAKIIDDAGLTAILSAHELTLLRRLSGVPGIGTPQRFGEDVYVPILPAALPNLARLASLQ